MIRRTSTALLALAALAAAACGSSSSGDSARMTVRLVDAPGEYQKIELDVQEVEIHSDAGGWLSLSRPNRVIDLLALRDGVADTLADTTIPAGLYGQLRLRLGSRNVVTLADGTRHALTVPSGMQSGVKLNVHFDVAPGTTKDVFIDFDAHRSIFVHATGASDKYILRPVVRAVDRVVTGSVSGKLTDASTGAGIDGAMVFAETIGTDGAPTVVAWAETAGGGNYTLGLLPVGGSYHVVSQPAVVSTTATVAYAPQASRPIDITAAAPTATWSAAFAPLAQLGGAQGAITPVASASQGDTVAVLASIPDGIIPRTLVIRTANAAVIDAATERWSIAGLPTGTFGLALSRGTIGPGGDALTGDTFQPALAATLLVENGVTATVNLVAP